MTRLLLLSNLTCCKPIFLIYYYISSCCFIYYRHSPFNLQHQSNYTHSHRYSHSLSFTLSFHSVNLIYIYSQFIQPKYAEINKKKPPLEPKAKTKKKYPFFLSIFFSLAPSFSLPMSRYIYTNALYFSFSSIHIFPSFLVCTFFFPSFSQ